MGSDDIFKKAKAKKADEHKRRKATRVHNERVLIVCEGEKTEPYYFQGLRKSLGLHPANVVIADKKSGLVPKSLVQYALEELKKDSDFDHVFCVFDKDKHPSYEAALAMIRDKRLKGSTQLHAITSIPCFEVWVLLHFNYSTAPFEAAAQDSNCALVVRELRMDGRIPGYDKGSREIFDELSGRLDDAIANAHKLERHHDGIGTDNPSTQVHKLVEHLQDMKRQYP